MERKASFWLSSRHWGLELLFGTICKISLEVGGGGAGDVGFFS